MTTVPTSEGLAVIIDALDAIACRAVTLKYCDDVAANKHLVEQVQIRAALILRLIKASTPPPHTQSGLRLVKR